MCRTLIKLNIFLVLEVDLRRTHSDRGTVTGEELCINAQGDKHY